ncbi:N-acetyltransferase [Curtobacterium sp. ISL-83]|uniref:GNAT family N-acetyltransferase n=1 Tax=Curtobacterium sp. ISL-83 TaxID=2819145 RepID=UPI001BE59253|nr:GNAT family N-acetyltransferase [Curtobacterium sp. ISL-83]MBT2503512.1 GNAT family N-acetyltransferase [Curtobacterium sp. ISL-83]
MITGSVPHVQVGSDADVAECIALWTAAVATRDGVQESAAVRARAAEKFRVERVALVVLRGSAHRQDGVDRPMPLDGFALVTAPGTGRPDDPADAAYLSLLAVRPDLQAHGVGRALLTAAVDAAVARGHRSVALHVLTDNARAVRLYAAAGFRPVGVPFPHALSGVETQTFVTGPR